MHSYRKNAIIVGALFIVATVAGVLSLVFYGSTLDAPDYLTRIPANETRIMTGALFELVLAFACASIAVWLYPILRKQDGALALGSVCFRLIEGALYVVALVGLLSLVTLSQEYAKAATTDASYFQILGASLLAVRDWAGVFGSMAFILGALMYYYLLFKSSVIPRWLSLWGLIAVPFWIAADLLLMFGHIEPFSTNAVLLNLPIAVNEMVLAVWLIVKGFNPAAVASLCARTAMDKTT